MSCLSIAQEFDPKSSSIDYEKKLRLLCKDRHLHFIFSKQFAEPKAPTTCHAASFIPLGLYKITMALPLQVVDKDLAM